MVRRLALLLLISSASNGLSQEQGPTPVVENGYVTRTTSLTDFDANGFHVVVSKKTTFWGNHLGDPGHTTTVDPYLGQGVTIYGDLKKKNHEVIASEVVFHPWDTTTRSGFALIERVLSPALPGGSPLQLLVRADGYVILINTETKTSFQKPLAAITDVTTDVWIKYHGRPQSDGIILADTAAFVENSVVDKEANLLDKTDYDPAAVNPDSKQNIARELILGRDPRRIPPYKDAALQARVDRIGNSLIPSYQRNLPDSDLRKFLFHFQLIDDPDMQDAWALPSGVILIPFQIASYLKDDSQLAAVLADNIASILEKQTYRMLPAFHIMTTANLTSTAAEVVLPGVGTATGIATAVRGTSIQADLRNQSGRVSLGLLHDAGYDIYQAPIAWWMIAAGTADKLPKTSVPPRAANLYKSLASTWHNYPEPTVHPHAPLPTQ